MMKAGKLLILVFFFIPAIGFSQELTGMWTGVLNNDSSTVRKDQSFEIALTEYRGKVYGYSHSTFMVNDTLYYILKRVRGTVEGDSCVVNDDKIISCNFLSRVDKGVKQTYTFRLNKIDSSWHLDGNWKTNKTKKYYSVGGSVKMAEEKDITKSKIFPHLQELNLVDEVASIQSKNNNVNNNRETLKPAVATANPRNGKVQSDVHKDLKENEETNKVDIVKSDRPNPAQQDNNKVNNIEQKGGVPSVTTVNPKKENQQADNNKAEHKKPETAEPVTAKSNVASERQQTDTGKIIVDNRLSPSVPAIAITNPAKENQKPDTSIKETGKPQINTAAIEKLNTRNEGQQAENNKSEHKNPETSELVTIKTNVKKREEQKNNNSIAETGHETSLPVASKTNPANGKEMAVSKSDVDQQVKTEPALSRSQLRREKRQQEKQARDEAAANEANLSLASKRGNDNPVAHSSLPAADVAKREVVQTQIVNFKNDSLELALYDNGEIDGDTVSVLLNGKLIMANEGLKATAIRKTIYIEPGQDSLQMIFYAENLGKYPPNTGLLIIHDGDDVYQVHFSSDLQRSAGLILKRKKN